MRRICFVRNNSVPWDASPVEEPECSTPNEEVQIQIADDVSSQGGQDEMSQSSACATRRNSSDEKEALPPSVENGTELIEGEKIRKYCSRTFDNVVCCVQKTAIRLLKTRIVVSLQRSSTCARKSPSEILSGGSSKAKGDHKGSEVAWSCRRRPI